MIRNKNSSGARRNIPKGLSLVCILLFLYGGLVLLGALFSNFSLFSVPRLAASPYYIVGSSIVIATASLIWIDHRWATPFAFVCAVLVTVHFVIADIAFARGPLMSAHFVGQIARAVFNIGLYWAGFFWYKKWRAESDVLS